MAAPHPYTYLGLVNELLSATNDVNLTSSNFDDARSVQRRAKQAIRTAIDDINMLHSEWPFNHEDGTEYVYANETKFALPSNATEIDWESFHVTDISDSTDRGEHVGARTYDDWNRFYRRDSTKGRPRFVFRSQDGAHFYVWPEPDKTYQVTFDYWKTYTLPSAHSDVPNIPERYRSVILEIAGLYMYRTKDDNGNYQTVEPQKSAKLRAMRTQLINDGVRYVQSPHSVQNKRTTGFYL